MKAVNMDGKDERGQGKTRAGKKKERARNSEGGDKPGSGKARDAEKRGGTLKQKNGDAEKKWRGAKKKR